MVELTVICQFVITGIIPKSGWEFITMVGVELLTVFSTGAA
jgi:hypothetical protein